jgi:hypothetical protein
MSSAIYPNQHEYTEEEAKTAVQYAKDIHVFIKKTMEDNTE